MNDLLYVNGCSWSSGAGLDPNVKKIISKEQFHSSLLDKEKELAWSSILSKNLNIPLINGSQGGAGQERITITTKRDITKLKLKYNVISIIQLTYPHRLLYPETNADGSWEWDSVLASENYKDPAYKLAQQSMINWTDEQIMEKYYSDIENLINFFLVHKLKLFLLPLSNYNYPDSIKSFFVKNGFYWAEHVTDLTECQHPSEQEHKKLASILSNYICYSS